ncbi:PAS/PAC sensor signal transduction histidine kinase (fragment) [Candidatus Sulfopaludibacter sp. SbA3]
MLERREGLISKLATKHPADAVSADDARVGEPVPGKANRVRTLATRAERARWLERSCVPIAKEESVHRVWGIKRDVTERKMTEESLQESEERYRSLFEAAGDAIFVSRDGFIDCNSRALELFGLTRDQIIGRMLWHFAPEVQPDGVNSQAKAEQKIAQAMAGNRVAFEWRSLRPDGTFFDSEVTLSGLILSGVPHWLALVKDITGRKQAERQIQEFNAGLERLVAERTAQLEAANQELESFSYSISHDLRAAIRGISACSQILLTECSEKLDASARQWLEYIHADTQQLDKLTLALLELSRVSRADLHRSDVDLGTISRDIAQRLTQIEPARHAEFKIADGLDAYGDPVLLQSVLENLVGNAWKFSKKRELAEIEIGWIDSETKGRVYFVRDNGVGFDMRFADKLFGAFQRLHRASEFAGTGIGLATVRRIIHRHGGRVWAESIVDAGTTIFFTLGRAS